MLQGALGVHVLHRIAALDDDVERLQGGADKQAVDEADLHRGLLSRLQAFLIELGRDFCFVGSEFPLQVGGRDFALDLLFFHRGLNCLVAIELKVDRFEPEHLGKLKNTLLKAKAAREFGAAVDKIVTGIADLTIRWTELYTGTMVLIVAVLVSAPDPEHVQDVSAQEARSAPGP